MSETAFFTLDGGGYGNTDEVNESLLPTLVGGTEHDKLAANRFYTLYSGGGFFGGGAGILLSTGLYLITAKIAVEMEWDTDTDLTHAFPWLRSGIYLEDSGFGGGST